MTPIPNQSGAVFGPTLGISRRMSIDVDALGRSLGRDASTYAAGGGNLNGSQATPLFSKSGTNGQRWQLLRTPRAGSGNYCGTI
jgi:hypothetical protein